MEAILCNHRVIIQLARALGINLENCTGFELSVHAGQIVSLKVWHHPCVEQVFNVVEVIEASGLSISAREMNEKGDEVTVSLGEPELTIDERRAMLGL